jgi:hypothetical protein
MPPSWWRWPWGRSSCHGYVTAPRAVWRADDGTSGPIRARRSVVGVELTASITAFVTEADCVST